MEKAYAGIEEWNSLYAKNKAESEAINASIERCERRLEKLRDKLHDIRTPAWPELMLPPIARALCVAKGLPPDSYHISGPCGLYNRCYIDIGEGVSQEILDYHELLEKSQWSITLQNTFIRPASPHMSLCYETGVTLNRYEKGTLGEVSGGNQEVKPLPETIEELAAAMLPVKKPEGKE